MRKARLTFKKSLRAAEQDRPDVARKRVMFAKLKTLLRKADERSIAAVWHRIGSLLNEFSSTECMNYIRHAGYEPS